MGRGFESHLRLEPLRPGRRRARRELAGDTTVQDVEVGTTEYVPGAITFTVDHGVTVTVKRASDGLVLGRVAVVAAAPPGIGDYSMRARDNAAPRSNPGQSVVESSRSRKPGPFTGSSG